MDRRERRRLKDEIDRGTLDAGIHRIEDRDGFAKESRLPLVKGATWGLAAGFAVAMAYVQENSPLGWYRGDIAAVLFGGMAAGAAVGAAVGWFVGRASRPPPP